MGTDVEALQQALGYAHQQAREDGAIVRIHRSAGEGDDGYVVGLDPGEGQLVLMVSPTGDVRFV